MRYACKYPLIYLVSITTLLAGCSSSSNITNAEVTPTNTPPYSVIEKAKQQERRNVLVLASFSGGGTRAAALSYGVLQGLRDHNYVDQHGVETNMLEQLSVISSVSGGSFTSAYYGLYQDEIFTRYEQEFLYRDVSKSLVNILFSPSYWFSGDDRSTAAADFYNKTLFGGSTFDDIKDEGPMIIINATDLGRGVRFSFVQEYFDLLCSDVNNYSVASAVAASSAVPFIFTPVVLENHDHCNNRHQYQLTESDNAHTQSKHLGLQSYGDKESRPFIHLIDGGITDNLGMLALYDLMQSNYDLFEEMTQHVDTVIVVSVDAATTPDRGIDSKPSTPKASDMVGAITGIQLHRYNDMIKLLVQEELENWQHAQPGRKTHFIDINLTDAENQEFINAIPTDFTLEPNQVDALIEHGYQTIAKEKALRLSRDTHGQ